jgi:amino acid transporter
MIPGAHYFTKLSETRKLPVASLAFTSFVAILVLLINIGAEKVFSTLLTIAVAGFFIAYAFPIMSQAILQRQGRHVPGPFTLGKWSKAVTLISSVWIVLELINVWWPRYPDLPWYQNWGVLLVTVILTVVGFIAYAFAPRHEMSGGGPAEASAAQDVTTVPDTTMSE